MSLVFGSVCSGIEAASIAWKPLGWHAAWLSEIERFPKEVLAHHYPDVPNLGDMRTIGRRILVGEVEAPDILVGGTPCQAFSIAGLREGLDDERGQLTLSYVRLFDAIDYVRGRAGKRAAICVWENVPGVLSDKTNAFGCFLAGLAGEDVELVPPGKKWANAGCVFGPTRTVAWRVLDAQYFGVAQRRRRVFVVASARKDCNPAEILFEFDGVRRDSAPSRESGQETAGTLASRTGAGGFPGTDEACSGYLQAFGGGNTGGAIDVATCLTTSGQRLDFDTETFAIQAGALRTNSDSGPDGVGVQSDIAYTMEARAEVQAVAAPICFSAKDYGADATIDLAPTLRAGGHTGSHANAGVMPAVAFSVALRGREGGATAELGDDVAGCLRASTGGGDKPHVLSQVADTLTSSWHQSNGATGGNNPGVINPVLHGMAVRRLMPMECERLQAFPDGYTNIPKAADGPRYKALGNSMCVNVMAFIGRRIQQEAV